MCYLISPILTQLEVILLRIEKFPGMQTVYGGFVVIGSLFLVSKGESLNNEKQLLFLMEQKRKLKHIHK
jgi:hypothetical protein